MAKKSKMNPGKKDPLKVVSVRFEVGMLGAIEKAAFDDDRDVSGLVRHVVKEWLKKNGYWESVAGEKKAGNL